MSEVEKAAEEYASTSQVPWSIDTNGVFSTVTLLQLQGIQKQSFLAGHAHALTPIKIDPNDENTFPLTWLCLLFCPKDQCWHDASKWNPGDTRVGLESGAFTHWLPLPPTPQREGE